MRIRRTEIRKWEVNKFENIKIKKEYELELIKNAQNSQSLSEKINIDKMWDKLKTCVNYVRDVRL